MVMQLSGVYLVGGVNMAPPTAGQPDSNRRPKTLHRLCYHSTGVWCDSDWGNLCTARALHAHCALLLDYVPPEEPPSKPLGNALTIR